MMEVDIQKIQYKYWKDFKDFYSDSKKYIYVRNSIYSFNFMLCVNILNQQVHVSVYSLQCF